MVVLAIVAGILAMLVILALIGFWFRRDDDRLRAKVGRILRDRVH